MASISLPELHRLRTIERKAQEAQSLQVAESFVPLFLENLGIILANIPRDQWPSIANTAFNHAASKHPYGARAYLENHTPC